MDNFTIIKMCRPHYDEKTMFRISCKYCGCNFLVKSDCPVIKKPGECAKVECPSCDSKLPFIKEAECIFDINNITKEEELTMNIHKLKKDLRRQEKVFISKKETLHCYIACLVLLVLALLVIIII